MRHGPDEDPLGREPDRRAVLRIIGGGVLGSLMAGCSGQHASSQAARTPRHAPTTVTPSASASSEPALPSVSRWSPSTDDVAPACKAAAVRHVEQLGTSQRSALQVLEAQYGGYLTTSASVLVVTRSWRLVRDRIVAGGHTYDVRLSRQAGGAWRVIMVRPSHPGPPGPRSVAARQVLASDRIVLPPGGRSDVASGHVHDSVLRAMLGLSRRHRIEISVIRSGHPLYVFGTTRLSDHPQGRAFDTWRIDGRAVIDPDTPQRLVTDYMRALADEGSYNVGGPYLLGAAPQWFSDATHHDHVHAGFTT